MDLTREQRMTILAAFLGWTLDAFDFFLLVFLFKDIAKEFGVEVRGGLRGLPDAGDAFHRRLHSAGSPIASAQADADAGHPLLLDYRRARCILAESVGLSGLARPVRRRDGRRMGPGQFTGDGIDSAASAWCRFRHSAMRLSGRLSARRDRLWPSLSERSAASQSVGARCSCSASSPLSSSCLSARVPDSPAFEARRRMQTRC